MVNSVYSYGFCLDTPNPYDNLRIRVVIGTSPEGSIETPKELFPTKKILDDVENLDTTTELLYLYPYKISEGKQTFLRV